MRFIKYSFLVVALFLCQNSNAQINKYLDGYVVNLESDTIRGQILYENKRINPKIIKIKSGGKKVNYSSADILHAEIIGENKYVSKKVRYSTNPDQIENLKSDNEIIWKESQEFLEVLSLGQVNLFKFVDENSKTHFFIKNNNENLEYLFVSKYKREGNVFVVPKYKNVLKKALYDCQDIHKEIDNSKFNQKSLQSVIRSYNECKNIKSSYISRESKRGLEIYLKGGFSSSKRFKNSDPSINLNGEINFEIIFPKNNKVWGITNGVGYRSYNAPIRPASNPEIVNFKFIRYNIGLKRIILNNTITSNLNGGIMNSISINNPYDGFGTYSQGMFMGIETFYKRWGIEFRFEGKNFWLSDVSFRKEYNYMVWLNYKIFKNKHGR